MEIHRRKEDEHELNHEKEEIGQNSKATFRFPTLDTAVSVTMKSILANSLPTFYGKNSEDLDSFVFNFNFYVGSITTSKMPRN